MATAKSMEAMTERMEAMTERMEAMQAEQARQLELEIAREERHLQDLEDEIKRQEGKRKSAAARIQELRKRARDLPRAAQLEPAPPTPPRPPPTPGNTTTKARRRLVQVRDGAAVESQSGKKVKVFWLEPTGDDGRYWEGTIIQQRAAKGKGGERDLLIRYDDGTKHWHNTAETDMIISK